MKWLLQIKDFDGKFKNQQKNLNRFSKTIKNYLHVEFSFAKTIYLLYLCDI